MSASSRFSTVPLALTLACSLWLTGCGGGGDSPNSSNSTVTVTGIGTTSTNSYVGVGNTATFYIVGTALDNAQLRFTGCADTITQSRSDRGLVVSCTVEDTPNVALSVQSASGTTVRQATFLTQSVRSLTQSTTGPIRFAQKIRFEATGTGLNQGIEPVSDACSDFEVITSSENAMTFDCYVSGREGTVALIENRGNILGTTANITGVEQPEVEIVIQNLGTIKVALAGDAAPITVYNYLRYVNDGYYNGTIFHRVINGANTTKVVQGGGFTAVGANTLTPQTGTLRDSIPLETTAFSELSNTDGTIAMARTNVVDSATSEFFFNTADNSAAYDYLNSQSPGYAVFGTITQGRALLDSVMNTTTRAVGIYSEVPDTVYTITSVTQTQ